MSLPEYDEKTLLIEAYKLPPQQAIAFFRAKGFKITWDWRETLGDANNQVFQVAKSMNLDVLSDIHDSLDDALSKGLTFESFQKHVEPKLSARGWTGKKYALNPDGELQLVELGTPRRLKTIYQTNTQSAYNAGRWEIQAEDIERRPYLMLIEVVDPSSRPDHVEMSGSIARVDDPFWNAWYPPNGFNCRGRTRSLSQKQAEDRKIEIKSDKKPDQGFAGNPGKKTLKPNKSNYRSYLWDESVKMEPLNL